MKTFITVLKNNYLRTKPRIILVAVMTVVALSSTMLAVYLSGLHQVKGRVALVAEDSSYAPTEKSEHLKITVLDKKPPYSALVEQKYDAYVSLDREGNYQIETLRRAEYKDMLLYLLQNPKAEPPKMGTERGVGVNIIGFMMMFLIMMSFSNLFVFADDKELGQLGRIFMAPSSFGGYLAAHVIYCMSLLLPEYILLVILKLSGRNIGFSLLQYAGLIAVTGLLGISIALLLYVLIQKADNATMLGNSIAVLATVLSGSFYSFSKNNELLDNMIKVLPQKELMDFAGYLQNGKGIEHSASIIYVIAFAAVLFILSCKKLRKMYVRKI
ncbi:ABC transporter permease [Anaerocolumna xylanovorans]|uniref:ABC-2 type transport system permease protein n=1 Tax=Anaerocolumna xylanovorans DSM 12503 TaxID=1121345 RepID=A0A1M7Y6Z0_9FIRM|nr:ABC transporter permease [Anaerocolumna xylanovorans]SHO48402.1 ABC-2 type transport system permease protein [Anaerocolumna xylanovorans DSM 12503]